MTSIPFIMAAGAWLASLVLGVLAWRWSSSRRDWQRVLAVASAGLAMGIAYVGRALFSLTATRTVNGSVQWKLDSGWFFIASMVLGGVTLVIALSRCWRPAATGASRRIDGGRDGHE